MKKRTAIALILLLALLISGCTVMNAQKEVAAAIGAELPQGELLSDTDSHGGFHGDGLEYIVIQFDEDVLKDNVSKLEGWYQLPMSDSIQTLLYGTQSGHNINGPFIHDDAGNPLLPEITNGYYFFQDRFDGAANPYDDSELFTRSAFNLTVAVFDTDTNQLHFLRFDT